MSIQSLKTQKFYMSFRYNKIWVVLFIISGKVSAFIKIVKFAAPIK
jgi:hypothetical protein